MKVCVLCSGSKGNCILVKEKDTQIIIDAGVTYKYYLSAMSEIGCDPAHLDGIFISHEHGDHINGAGVIHRKTKAPLYLLNSTYIYSEKRLGNLHSDPIIFSTGDDIIIGDICVHPFPSSHDASESCNFFITPQTSEATMPSSPQQTSTSTHPNTENQAPPTALCIATDLGTPTHLLKNNLKKATTIVIESNHDVKMLKEGPYEWYLKQRILSNTGHLSNEQATTLINEVLQDQHKRIILAHLSEINNTPHIAYNQMKYMLKKLDNQVELIVSHQDRPTDLFEV